MKRLTPLLLLGALLGTGLSSCRPAEPEARPARLDVTAPPPKETAQPVQVLTAKQGTLRAERHVTGTAEASRVSNVAARASGALLAYDVAEGASVAAGAVVARLDDTDARQAAQNARAQLEQARISYASARQSLSENAGALEAAVTAAQSSLNLAEKELRRAEEASGTPQAALDAARDRVTQARAGLAQAQAQLSANRAGTGAGANLDLLAAQVKSAQDAVTQAEDRTARARVVAPFAGVVSAQLVQPGEFAAQGSPVFRLVDTSSVRAAFGVSPQDAAQLPAGTRMNLGYGGTNYVAVVEGGERIAGEDRQVPLRARIQGGAAIPPGASVQIRYRLDLAGGVLVPSRAMNVAGSQNYVYVADGDVARRVKVDVLAENDGQVAVSGLKEGAQLIYPVPSALQDGSRVQVQRAARSSADAGGSQ